MSKKPLKRGSTVSIMPPKASETAIGESDSDTPLTVKLTKKKEAIQRSAEKEAKAIRKEQNISPPKRKAKKEESDDEPIVKKKRQSNGEPSKKPPKRAVKDESDDDKPLAKKSALKKGKVQGQSLTATPVKKGGKKVKIETPPEDDGEDEEKEERWWDKPKVGDGTIKWKTLEHGGVVFPPPYEPLPKSVKLLYDGTPVSMSLEAEEVAGFFGGMLNSTQNVENLTFQKNFFTDFTKILKETGGAKDKKGDKVSIKEFSKCDFKPIFEWFDSERTRKKAMSGAEKKALKAEKDEAEAPYAFCVWDGRKQKVGNFRVEPPSLFRGRGEHPKTGMVKKRVLPEQVTINIGKGAKVPDPPAGHKWKEVKHDQEGTWLAMWQENINGAYKYVMLAANSDVKGKSDHNKFEKARELKVKTDSIMCPEQISNPSHRNTLT